MFSIKFKGTYVDTHFVNEYQNKIKYNLPVFIVKLKPILTDTDFNFQSKLYKISIA